MGAVVLMAAGLGVYGGLQWLRPVEGDGGVQLYTVTQRSFPVVLQQKGELRATRQIDVRCELEGRSTIIKLIEEGKAVHKGDLLVELASDEIDDKIREAESRELLTRAAAEAGGKELQILIDRNASEIRKAEVKHELAREAISKYEEGDAVQSRQEMQLAVDEAAYNLRRSEATLKDSQELLEQGFVTRIEVENDEATVYQNRIKLQNAELALSVLNKFTVPMELRKLRSEMEDALNELECKKKEAAASEEKLRAELDAKKSDHKLAEDKLAKLKEQKAKTRIVAPEDGLVVYFKEEWWDESRIIKEGAQVYEQQILIQLPDTSSMKTIVRVHEAKAELLHEGLPALVQVEGLPGRRFTGRVSKIAVLADSKWSWLNSNIKEYETEVLLDGTFNELKPGLTAHVEIKVADLTDVVAVPVQAVFGKGNKYYVFVQDGKEARPVEVELGPASTEFVEIKAGLGGGERVLLAVSEEMKLALPDKDADNSGVKWSEISASRPASAPAEEVEGTAPATQPASQPASRPVEEKQAGMPAPQEIEADARITMN